MGVKVIESDKINIMIKDLFGVNLRRSKPRTSGKTGTCQGIELHTYSEKDANKLKHQVVYLSHPSEAVCGKWLAEIDRISKSKSC